MKQQLHEATAPLEKAKSGFRKTGIFLHNDDVFFSDEDFLSSAVTEREQHQLDGNTDLLCWTSDTKQKACGL